MTVTPIALPFAQQPVSATFIDGFGLVNVNGTNQWYQSNLDDLSTWQALNFTSADALPDFVVALFTVERYVWVLKQFDTEIWFNGGLPGFAFQRQQGVFIETGCAAAYSVAKVGQGLCWLARDPEGTGYVVMANGFSPQRISTNSIERAIQSYAAIDDAIGYCYQQEGHLFYVLTFPTGDHTWVYDVSTQLWHERARFYNGTFHRHQSACYAFFNNQHLVGDPFGPHIFKLDLDTGTDCCMTRKWLRSWRALQRPIEEPMRFNSLSIDMETGGIGTPQGTNPLVMLRWSDDGGQTWSDYRIAPAGKIGQTARRVKFNRLGSTRRNSGLDRIFELSSTDVFKTALIGADLQ